MLERLMERLDPALRKVPDRWALLLYGSVLFAIFLMFIPWIIAYAISMVVGGVYEIVNGGSRSREVDWLQHETYEGAVGSEAFERPEDGPDVGRNEPGH